MTEPTKQQSVDSFMEWLNRLEYQGHIRGDWLPLYLLNQLTYHQPPPPEAEPFLDYLRRQPSPVNPRAARGPYLHP